MEELREQITKQDLRYSQTVALLAKVLEVEKAIGLSDEQVVGTWIDGKPLYRIAKYYQGIYTVVPKGTVDFGALGASNVDLVIDLMCTVTNAADTQRYFYGHGNFIYNKIDDHVSFYSDGEWSNLRPIVTMLYTKTTD